MDEHSVEKPPPEFKRGKVAKLLACTTLTIRNKERSGAFPIPRRTPNDYRTYNLTEMIRLQKLYTGTISLQAMLSFLYDQGYTDVKQVNIWLATAMAKYESEPVFEPEPQQVQVAHG